MEKYVVSGKLPIIIENSMITNICGKVVVEYQNQMLKEPIHNQKCYLQFVLTTIYVAVIFMTMKGLSVLYGMRSDDYLYFMSRTK
jgi:hypothetical protein